jgi:hypothetical protein
MSNRNLRLEYLDPAQLDGHPSNWKFHPPAQLAELTAFVDQVGFAGALLLNERTGKLLDGHGRKEAFAGMGVVPVLVGSWDEEQERQILLKYDALGYASVGIRSKLDELMKSVNFPKVNFSPCDELLRQVRRQAMPDPAAAAIAAEPEPGAESLADEVAIPMDSIWATDNAYGVPALLPELAAREVPFPVMPWGCQGARRLMVGTWHCYTHDAKFEPLWKQPHRLLLSRPGAGVEPNFSTTEQTPFAFSLYQIYRKRWVARFWQSQGLRVFVDLNVEAELNAPHDATGGHPPNLLGVPRGWSAFASRAHADRPENLDREWEIAREWSGQASPLFLVVGGGRRVKERALANRWNWVPEHRETRRGQAAEDEPCPD